MFLKEGGLEKETTRSHEEAAHSPEASPEVIAKVKEALEKAMDHLTEETAEKVAHLSELPPDTPPKMAFERRVRLANIHDRSIEARERARAALEKGVGSGVNHLTFLAILGVVLKSTLPGLIWSGLVFPGKVIGAVFGGEIVAAAAMYAGKRLYQTLAKKFKENRVKATKEEMEQIEWFSRHHA